MKKEKKKEIIITFSKWTSNDRVIVTSTFKAQRS